MKYDLSTNENSKFLVVKKLYYQHYLIILLMKYTIHRSLLVNSQVLWYNSLLQEACFCRPQHPWVQASTPSVSMVVWSCSACSCSMTHRRWSKGLRITPSTVPRSLTPSTRKYYQVSIKDLFHFWYLAFVNLFLCRTYFIVSTFFFYRVCTNWVNYKFRFIFVLRGPPKYYN